jgi:flavin reductase (DIM6/NTAB) family NADH-FMN oxidoreductase RutF
MDHEGFAFHQGVSVDRASPVVLLTTAHDGALNVMTMSWHMLVDFDPPLIACVVSDRDHSFVALRATKECVIGIPPFELAEKVVAIGNCSGREVEKFATFRLTPKKALCVSAPWSPSASPTLNAGSWIRAW